MNLKEALKDKLTEKELKNFVKSFDIIGDIAILEIPKELEKKEKEIAEVVVKIHPRIKTVCKKSGERFGEFRLRKMKILFGKETETIHKEYGCKFKLDVTKVYFSPRESTERQRIAEQIKPKEKILVMFAGIGPYAIIIAKKQPKAKVYAIEINPDAYNYMVENIKLNKVEYQVIPILGDVNKECPKYFNFFDRIVMPLPKGAYEFLSLAIKCLKSKGIIHFYYWGGEDAFQKAEELIKNECKKLGKKYKILNKRKVLPYGPRTYKICIDFQVN